MATPSPPINPAAPPSTARLMRSVLVVMAGFLLTKGVSFLQTIIIANRFGAGAEYDTFAAGSTLPDYIVRLIGGGALGVAFIPVFSGLLNKDDQAGAWRLASQVFNTLLITAGGVSLLVMIFAPVLVNTVVAPGLSAADAAQTAALMRILSISTIIFSVSGILSGILHGHNHFVLPVLAPIFQDIGLLIGVIFFIEPLGIYGLAWGVLLGALLHIGVQVPGMFWYQFRWQPILGWRDPLLRRVVALMLPRVLIGAAFVVNLLAITNISSRMGEGAISAFGWGIRFMDIPQALIGTAMGIVIFPTLSALSALGEVDKRREAFAGALRFILVATIPAAAGLVLVSHDALRILFNAEESARIFTVIQILSLAIVIQSLHEVLTRAFYAQQDTLRPLIFSLIATGVTVLTVVGMYQVYLATEPPLWSPLAVGGPALGYVVAFLVEVILLAVTLKGRWGDIALPQLSQTALRSLGATLLMSLAVLVVDFLMVQMGIDTYGIAHILIRIGVDVAVGGVVFVVAGLLLGVDELRQLPRLIREVRAKNG